MRCRCRDLEGYDFIWRVCLAGCGRLKEDCPFYGNTGDIIDRFQIRDDAYLEFDGRNDLLQIVTAYTRTCIWKRSILHDVHISTRHATTLRRGHGWVSTGRGSHEKTNVN